MLKKNSISRTLRLVKEGSWIVVGQFMSVVASLVLVRIITEHLDPTQYGQLALALTLGTLISQIGFSGAMPGIMRFYTIAVEKSEAHAYFLAAFRMMGYGSIAALGLSIFVLLGLPILGQPDLVGLSVLAILFSMLANYNATQSMIQNAARQRGIVAFHGSLDAWLRVLFVVVLLAWIGNSAKAVVVGYIGSLLLVLSSQAVFVRRLIPSESTRLNAPNSWVEKIWTYSKPFVFFNGFTWIQASSDRWALDTFSNAQDVGFYAVLVQLGLTPISMAVGLMTTLIGPILFQQSGDTADYTKNSEVHRRAWQLTFVAWFFTFLGCLLAYILHASIFSIMVAKQYWSVSYLLPWMVLAGGASAAGQILSLKFMSDLNTQALVWPKIITSIIGALMSFAGAYVAGLSGVVFAIVIFSLFQFFWLGFLNRQPKNAFDTN